MSQLWCLSLDVKLDTDWIIRAMHWDERRLPGKTMWTDISQSCTHYAVELPESSSSLPVNPRPFDGGQTREIREELTCPVNGGWQRCSSPACTNTNRRLSSAVGGRGGCKVLHIPIPNPHQGGGQGLVMTANSFKPRLDSISPLSLKGASN